MNSFQHFLEMGGYARFVWPSYALAALVLAGFVATSVSANRRVRRELASLQAQRGGRRR